MTEKERKLASDNMNIVYKYIHNKNLPLDIWEDIFMLILCECATKYDENTNFAFSSYLWRALDNEYAWRMRSKYADKRTLNDGETMVYFDQPTWDEAFDIKDTEGENDENFTMVEYKDLLNHFERRLVGKEADVFDLYLKGYNSTEIRKELGFSRQRFNQLNNSIRTKWGIFNDGQRNQINRG